MTIHNTLIAQAHLEWHPYLAEALNQVDSDYLNSLSTTDTYLPTYDRLFAAFTIPLSQVNYILVGESPYPRAISANGYAFWDAAVGSLWSSTGFSREVNRATSLRNFIKMLLLARGDLSTDFSQPSIAALDSTKYCQTGAALFGALIQHGFLLLNASLVYSPNEVLFHARMWKPMMASLLSQLAQSHPQIQLILFGRIAKHLPYLDCFKTLIAEHPYNISFITNEDVLDFFKPLDLLHEATHRNKH